jgi:hypothetical protein
MSRPLFLLRVWNNPANKKTQKHNNPAGDLQTTGRALRLCSMK